MWKEVSVCNTGYHSVSCLERLNKIALNFRCPQSFHIQAFSKILDNQISMSLYGYIYFIWDLLHSTFCTSV